MKKLTNYQRENIDYESRGNIGCFILVLIVCILLFVTGCTRLSVPVKQPTIKAVVTHVELTDSTYWTFVKSKHYIYSAIMYKKHRIGDTLTLQPTSHKANSVFQKLNRARK